MSTILNEKFVRQTSETKCEIDQYTPRLESAVEALSFCQPNVVLESEQWSKLAAIQTGGGVEVYSAEQWEEQDSVDCDLGGAWIAYSWNREEEAWDLAFVATWPASDE